MTEKYVVFNRKGLIRSYNGKHVLDYDDTWKLRRKDMRLRHIAFSTSEHSWYESNPGSPYHWDLLDDISKIPDRAKAQVLLLGV